MMRGAAASLALDRDLRAGVLALTFDLDLRSSLGCSRRRLRPRIASLALFLLLILLLDFDLLVRLLLSDLDIIELRFLLLDILSFCFSV